MGDKIGYRHSGLEYNMNLAGFLLRLTALFVLLFVTWVVLGLLVGPQGAGALDQLLLTVTIVI